MFFPGLSCSNETYLRNISHRIQINLEYFGIVVGTRLPKSILLCTSKMFLNLLLMTLHLKTLISHPFKVKSNFWVTIRSSHGTICLNYFTCFQAWQRLDSLPASFQDMTCNHTAMKTLVLSISLLKGEYINASEPAIFFLFDYFNFLTNLLKKWTNWIHTDKKTATLYLGHYRFKDVNLITYLLSIFFILKFL